MALAFWNSRVKQKQNMCSFSCFSASVCLFYFFLLFYSVFSLMFLFACVFPHVFQGFVHCCNGVSVVFGCFLYSAIFSLLAFVWCLF